MAFQIICVYLHTNYLSITQNFTNIIYGNLYNDHSALYCTRSTVGRLALR